MIDNEKNEFDDEFDEFDEFDDDDLIDIESGDDFDDEDWDDLDDDNSAATASKPTKKKSSLSGMLVLVAGGALVLGGGGYFYLMSQNKQVVSDFGMGQTVDQISNDAMNAGTLPIPSPIANIKNNTNDSKEEFVPPYQDNLDQSMDDAISALSQTGGHVDGNASSGNPVYHNESQENALTPMPEAKTPREAARLPDVANEQQTSTPNAAPSLASIEGRNSNNNSAPNNTNPVGQKAQFDTAPNTIAAQPQAPSLASIENNTNQNQAQNKTNSNQSILQSQNKDLQIKLAAANREAESLQKKVSDMEVEMKQLTAKISRLEREEKTATKAATSKKAAVSRSKQKPDSSTKTARKRAPKSVKLEWTLKSAQPGIAVLSVKGSRDTTYVEVGNTVPGLGKILFIGSENGKWVVKGSQGRVSQ